MPILKDRDKLKLFEDVFSRVKERGAIKWEQRPRDELYSFCPSISPQEVNECLAEFFAKGGQINEVEEQSPALRDMPEKRWWYEFRITMPRFATDGTRLDDVDIYVKARMMPGPQLYVVSCHEHHEKDKK